MKLPWKFVYKSNETFLFIFSSIVIPEHHEIWKLCLKFCRWVWQIQLEPTAVCKSDSPVPSTAVLSRVTRVECFVRKYHVFIEKSDFCLYLALRPTFSPAPAKPSCSTFHSSFWNLKVLLWFLPEQKGWPWTEHENWAQFWRKNTQLLNKFVKFTVSLCSGKFESY